MPNRVLILDSRQIEQKISRLAYQLYEDSSGESEIVIAGIARSGFAVAEKISDVLKKISTIKVTLAQISLDKHGAMNDEVKVSVPREKFANKTVIVVDDVLNSGKTLMHALRPFLDADLKKLRTVVLVDRNHKSYPVSADFSGLTLATTLQEHITVEMDGGIEGIYLS